MELGSNSPVIVLPDADIEKAANAIVASGYANAGQVCISAQRILTHEEVYGDLLDCLQPRVGSLSTGNPLDENVRVGPMVRESDAERVERWIRDAAATGGRLLTGGARDRALVEPAIVADVRSDMRISCDELFGAGGRPDPVRVRRRGHRERQRHQLRPFGGGLHREPGQRDALRPRSRIGQHPYQLGHAVAR